MTLPFYENVRFLNYILVFYENYKLQSTIIKNLKYLFALYNFIWIFYKIIFIIIKLFCFDIIILIQFFYLKISILIRLFYFKILIFINVL